MIVDFHSHILPYIDDGSENEEMSLEMLNQSIAMGAERFVATPHYYYFKNQSVEDAVLQRNWSYEKLLNYVQKQGVNVPRIYKGFEVHFDSALKDLKNLDKLCIEGTNCLLVEMPYKKWNSDLIEELYRLSIKGFKLIMAHVDRYYSLDSDSVYKLLELDVCCQFNAEMLNNRKDRKFLSDYVKSGRIGVMGSDMHNITNRPPNMKKAYDIAKKKLKSIADDLFYNNAIRLLEG